MKAELMMDHLRGFKGIEGGQEGWEWSNKCKGNCSQFTGMDEQTDLSKDRGLEGALFASE